MKKKKVNTVQMGVLDTRCLTLDQGEGGSGRLDPGRVASVSISGINGVARCLYRTAHAESSRKMGTDVARSYV